MKGNNTMKMKTIAAAVVFALTAASAYALNPLMTQMHSADPQGFVYNGRIYIVCSHDLPNQRGYDLYDYVLVSSDDLQNWTDHGVCFSTKEIAPWAGHAYAPGMAIRDGKCYLYFPNGGSSIGVAVADKPEGPYTDPLKKALISGSVPSYRSAWLFDPCGFVDDDGKAYVYYGGNGNDQARILELKSDMITPMSDQATHLNVPRFFEASYMHKYKGKYYFSYSTNFNGQPAASIDYMMGDTATGPFTHKGTILKNPPDNVGNNNHASVLEYKGHWYVVYHNRRLAIQNDLQNKTDSRSVNIDEMFYNEDGTIKEVVPTLDGPKQLKYVDPTAKNRFVTMCRQNNIATIMLDGEKITYLDYNNRQSTVFGTLPKGKTAQDSSLKTNMPAPRTTVLTTQKQDAWTKVVGVDFSKSPSKMTVSYAAVKDGATLEVHEGSATGELLGSCKLAQTDDFRIWKEVTFDLKKISGVHDLCFVIKIPTAWNEYNVLLDWYQAK